MPEQVTRVRPDAPGDVDAAGNLLAAFFREAGFDTPEPRLRANLATMVRAPDCAVLLAHDAAGAAVAVATLTSNVSVEQGRAAELEDLYVVPEARGRGLGSRMIGACVAEARGRLGCDMLCVVVAAAGAEAQGLLDYYAGRGFRDVGRRMLLLPLEVPATAPPRLRPARSEEAPALSELAMRSKASWGYDDAFMAQCRAALTVDAGLVAAGGVFVAEGTDDRPLGFHGLRCAGAVAELEFLFVAPEWLGRGVGRALLDHAVDEARRLGCGTLRVLADPNARAFYAAQGFAAVGEAPSDAVPGRRLPVMERAL